MSSDFSELDSGDLAYALSGYRERLEVALGLQAEAYILAGELEPVVALRDVANALTNLDFEIEHSYGRSPLADELHGPLLRYLDAAGAGLLDGEPLSRDRQLAYDLARGLATGIADHFSRAAEN